MSDDLLRDAGAESEELADLYAVKQFLFYSGIGPQTYFLETVEGAFVRPSFMIKIVNMDLTPYNSYMDIMVYQMMIQFFTADYFEALTVAGQLVNLLANRKGVIIPKWNFALDPPEPWSVNGRSDDGEVVPMKMGIRVPPQDVLAAPFQEGDDSWNVPVTFTARSYRVSTPETTVIERIHHTNPDFTDPRLAHTVTGEVNTTPEA